MPYVTASRNDAEFEIGVLEPCKVKDRNIGEVKRMWVRRDMRGLGIGRRMLETLERFCAGISTMYAET